MLKTPAAARRRRTRMRATIAALVSASLAACDGGPGADAPDAEASAVLDPAAVRVVGTSEALASVRDLAVLEDGSAWALNSVEPFFVGFGPDGELLEAYGSSGGGPEEFGLPVAFVTGGIDGEAWVLDLRRHALIRVSTPGEPRAEIPLPRDSVPPGTLRPGMDLLTPTVRTARLGGEVLLPRTTTTMEAGIHDFKMAILGADLLAVDIATGSARGVFSLGDVLDDPAAGFEPVAGGFPLWFRLWATCDGEIRVYDRARNAVRAFSPQGDELDSTPLPPVRLTEVTPRQFARAVFGLRQAEVTGAVGTELTPADSARLLDQMVEQFEAEPSELAAYLPRYVDLRCADDGSVWMRPFDPEAGGMSGGRLWFRIEHDGATRELRLPERFDAFRFTEGRIWGVQRDTFDVAAVAWLPMPEGS